MVQISRLLVPANLHPAINLHLTIPKIKVQFAGGLPKDAGLTTIIKSTKTFREAPRKCLSRAAKNGLLIRVVRSGSWQEQSGARTYLLERSKNDTVASEIAFRPNSLPKFCPAPRLLPAPQFSVDGIFNSLFHAERLLGPCAHRPEPR